MLVQLFKHINACVQGVQCNHMYRDPRDGQKSTFRHACQKHKYHFGKHVGVGINPPTWNSKESEKEKD